MRRRRATRHGVGPRMSRHYGKPNARKNGTLDVAPLDLIAQALHEVGDFFELGMDRERTAERLERVLIVAEFLQDGAETRERTEMARLAREHLVDVGKRVRVVLLGEIDRKSTRLNSSHVSEYRMPSSA